MSKSPATQQVKIEKSVGQNVSVSYQNSSVVDKSKQNVPNLDNVVNSHQTPSTSKPVKNPQRLKNPSNWKCVECKQVKKHYARGMCKPCYRRIFSTPKVVAKRKTSEYIERHQRECVECKQVKLIKARDMCGSCYHRIFAIPKQVGRFKDPQYIESHQRECVGCKQMKLIYARDMCRPCYERIFLTPKRVAKRKTAEYIESHQRECVGCKQVKKHHARGMCGACYMKTRSSLELQKQCIRCKQIKPYYGRGYCSSCYRQVVKNPSQKHNKTPSKELRSEVGNSQIVLDPKSQVTQQNPSKPKSQLTRQLQQNPPAPKSQITQQTPATFTTRRPIPTARRPAPVISPLVHAFRQILAQQNDAEYITLSSGDEDDNY